MDISARGYISQQLIHGANRDRISLAKAREIARKMGYQILLKIEKKIK